jgi:hypothetical protein
MDDTNPVEELEDPRHLPGTALWVIAGLFVLLVAVGLYFREAKPAAGVGAKVADVTRHSAAFLGHTVTVRGEVDKIVAPNAFIIEDEGPGSEMLVVATKTATLPPAKTLERLRDLRVIGEVRDFDLAQLRTDLGIPETDDVLNAVKDKPVLYAFQVIVPPAEAEKHARSDTPQQ